MKHVLVAAALLVSLNAFAEFDPEGAKFSGSNSLGIGCSIASDFWSDGDINITYAGINYRGGAFRSTEGDVKVMRATVIRDGLMLYREIFGAAIFAIPRELEVRAKIGQDGAPVSYSFTLKNMDKTMTLSSGTCSGLKYVERQR